MVEKKTKYYAGAAVALVIVVTLVAAALLGPATTTASASGYRIVANVNKDCAGTPWFVGQDIGYFSAGGIDFVDAGALDWSLQPAALINGNTNVYDGHPNTIINLLESGVKVKGVVMGSIDPSDGNESEQHMHWLARSSDGYTNIKDMVKGYEAQGKKVTIAVGATGICADLENSALFRENGLTANDFNLVTLSDPLQEAALTTKLANGGYSIDIAVLHPPFYTAAEAHGGVTIIAESSDTFGVNAGVSLLVFTEDFIEKNPDAVRAFIKAYKASEQWANDHRVQAGVLTANKIGLTTANAHYYSYNGSITDASIQVWIDEMVADGLLKQGQYKPSDLYTTEFSDTWVNESSPQPLNPFGKSTLVNSTWVNQTSASTISVTLGADLGNIQPEDSVSILGNYIATGETVQPRAVSYRSN